MMNTRHFLRFPGFLEKAVTLSYDDGCYQDKRLIEIMNKYGIKGTFNLNSGLFSKTKTDSKSGRLTKEEAFELYSASGNEVAVHGHMHCSLAAVNKEMAIRDVQSDRAALEALFGKIINGMAYANGSYSSVIIEILKSCGISYARTTVSTKAFDLPADWLQMPATCHHNDPKLMDLVNRFLEKPADYYWSRHARLFYLWGHSYEFDQSDNWNVIEKFCAAVGGRDDIWYASNGEIYGYVTAYDRLIFSAENTLVYNPSATDIYINYFGKEYIVPAGKSVFL